MKVVVADDSGFIKEMISHFLVSQGHEILGFASNGRETINLCNQLKPDTLFLDLVMPDMNGVDTAIEVLKENPSLKIIICTSLDEPWVEERTRNIGCRHFFVFIFCWDF